MGQPHPTNRSWTPKQIERLKELANAGASPARIAAATKRSIMSVKMRARQVGVEIRTVRQIRARMRDAEREVR